MVAQPESRIRLASLRQSRAVCLERVGCTSGLLPSAVRLIEPSSIRAFQEFASLGLSKAYNRGFLTGFQQLFVVGLPG